MYVQRYTVTHSRNHCCQGYATIRYFLLLA